MIRRLPLLVLLIASLSFVGVPARADAAAPADMGKLYDQLQWRQVGPFRGGWSTMAVGVPGEPNVFYFGGADGGIWKTIDAGLTWKPQFQQGGSISIGALAVAPSDPDIIYIGTGQP